LTDLDRRSLEVMIENLGIEFGRMGAGRVKIDEKLIDQTQPWQPRGGFHHMGTTRMSLHPRDGVVDAHCRVHSTDNLYVAGSSVFPTSGHVNPTLTLVALAVRLADHLREVQ
jgi:choline dehydrogenase-like flavoprotein